MQKEFEKFTFEEPVDLTADLRFVNVFGDEYRKHQYPDTHPLHFCAVHVNTNELDTVHTHPYVQIWYTKSGSYRHYFKDEEFVLTEGSMIIIPPNYPHYIDTRSDCVLVRCEFSYDFIKTIDGTDLQESLFNLIYLEPVLVNSKHIDPHHYFSGDTAESLGNIFDELCHEFEKKDEFSELFLRSNLIRLLALIAREFNIQGHNVQVNNYRESFDSAIEYINNHYGEKLYLNDVCKIAMLGRTTFNYLFKQLMGMPFTQYVQYLRVLHAQELLANTNRTQQDIALVCGFQRTAFLHRVFKQFTGLLPGEYRRKMKEEKSKS